MLVPIRPVSASMSEVEYVGLWPIVIVETLTGLEIPYVLEAVGPDRDGYLSCDAQR